MKHQERHTHITKQSKMERAFTAGFMIQGLTANGHSTEASNNTFPYLQGERPETLKMKTICYLENQILLQIYNIKE